MKKRYKTATAYLRALPEMLRGLLLGLAWLALTSCDNSQSPVVQKPSHPNILLILADDLGNNDLGSFGDGSATTPSIDALATGGVRFHRHYAHATCRPSRVELLTGLSASRVGVPPHIRGITPELVTLPEALSQGGYLTSHIGKWHLGHQVGSALPDRQGFAHWFGFLHALTTKTGDMADAKSSYFSPWLMGSDRPLARYEGHLTEVLTTAAIEQMQVLSSQEKPWFLNVWYFAPHAPVQPAQQYARNFPKTPEGKYLALVSQLDAAIGRLLTALEESGALKNTIVVFLSDNGGVNKTRDSNKPYFGKKNTFYEGGFRTPLVLSMPGSLISQDIYEPVFIRDLMPTLLHIAGLEAPDNLDGVSISPLLEGKTVAREPRYFWDFRSFAWAQQGLLDLAHNSLVYGPDIQRRLDQQSFFAPPVPMNNTEKSSAASAIKQWQQTVRRVNMVSEQRPDGTRSLTGDSYRRTPGFGAWSLQLPVLLGSQAIEAASQAGQFSLKTGGGRIDLQFPGQHLSVEADSFGCQLLTVSSYYEWPDRRPELARAHVKIWMGEELLKSVEYPITRDLIRDSYPATEIAAEVGNPLISNSFLITDLVSHYRTLASQAVTCGSSGVQQK